MAQRSLTLHQHQRLRPGSLGGLQHRRLHGAGGVVDPYGIEGHAPAADQNPGLAGAHEAGVEAAALCGRQQLQAGAHLAHGHVRSHRQQPPAGQGGGPGGGHLQPRRFLAQIPDPLARAATGGCQLRVIRQAAVQAAGRVQPCVQPCQHVGAHLRRQPATGGRQPHHRHRRPEGQGRRHVRHHRHRPGDAGERRQVGAGMGRIDHRHDRPVAVAQHRQAGLAREVVEPAVQQQHQGSVGAEHQGTSIAIGFAGWPPLAVRAPRPGRSAGRSRSPSRFGPLKGSSIRFRWLSRSGHSTRGSS